MDVLVVEDELDEVLDVVLVVVNAADLVEKLLLGKAVLKELEVVVAKKLTLLEAAVDGLPKVDVVVEVLVLGEMPGEAFDVILVLEDTVEVECDVDVEWGGVMVLLTTCVVCMS